ncbi:unnamed protein product [Cuscuta campestris]|uniref:Retrotransposon gag domain-containing protein n=1 Tax=Cuscuta campestris TaxID=132261 RepID=A0A484ME47_9ASTE|nr:unnamed protein product [Cuscuta campestris]
MADDSASTTPRDHRDERIDALQQTMHQMQTDLEGRFARLEALVLANRPVLPTPPHLRFTPGVSGEAATASHAHLPKPKLEAPKTDGTEPLRWLYKVQEYFTFYDIPPTERLRCVALMLEGPAADWYQWRRNGNLIRDWADFVEKFKLRFDPLHYVDYFGQLAKLRQTGSLMDYQAEFEKILHHVTGASETNLISLFHSGLKPHLQHEIALLSPETLSDSFALARELEAKHNALLHTVTHRQPQGLFTGQTRSPPGRQQPSTVASPTEGKSSLATPIRRLTRAEKLEKDAKGLCYNCDQRWMKGHRCGHVLLLIGDDDDAPDCEHDAEPAPVEDLCVTADISSLQSLSGPVRIHAQRRVLVGGATEVQGLVEWSDGDKDDATWEPLDKLRQFYPDLHLEDKVVIEQGESVTTESQGEVHGEPRTQAPEQDDVGAHPCKELRRGSRERRPPAWRKDYET